MPDKAEFIPDLAYGDGRPLDPAHEQAIIKTANALIDYKSAHQGPFLWSTWRAAALGGNGTDLWNTLFAGPIYLGQDQLSTPISRALTVAPFWSSETAGIQSWLRISLFRVAPQLGPSQETNTSPGAQYYDPTTPNESSRTAIYGPTTSTTWQVGADATLNVGVKDLHFGFAWLLVEGAGAARCHGLSKMIEGPRVVT